LNFSAYSTTDLLHWVN